MSIYVFVCEGTHFPSHHQILLDLFYGLMSLSSFLRLYFMFLFLAIISHFSARKMQVSNICRNFAPTVPAGLTARSAYYWRTFFVFDRHGLPPPLEAETSLATLNLFAVSFLSR